MKLTQAAWDDYISRLSRLNQKAGQLMREYMDGHPEADTDALIRYAYALVTKYGEGSAELACQMYDALAEAQGVTLPAAEPAPTATYGEVTGMVKATQDSPANLQSGVSRMVKQAGADTTARNAIRDGAEWAWVPHGDACPFCRMLASNGWQRASKNLLKKGHAQHIHANCDCEFAVRFSREFNISGYDPEEYLRQYREAGSDINNWRRIDYAARKDEINAQKRAAYKARKSIVPLSKAHDDGKMYLDDVLIPVGVGAKAKTVYVQLPDGSLAELTPGTRVTKVQTIAGKGRNRQIDIVDFLVDEFPESSPEKWEKQKGMGYVDFEGRSRLVELHWYYEPTVGRVKWKIKPDQGGNWFYYDDEDE